MSKKEKRLIFWSLLLGSFLVITTVFYNLGASSAKENTDPIKEVQNEKPGKIGEPGSAHEHLSLILSINGKTFDFNRSKFAEQSDKVHFHEGNGWIIHKHAKGVTLSYFLETLGMKIKDGCLIKENGTKYCEDEENSLVLISNGEVVENPKDYLFDHGDKLLLDYGSGDISQRMLRYNNIPDIPWRYIKNKKEPESSESIQ